MTNEEGRQAMIERHDALIETYNDTGDQSVLDEIALLEIVLLHSPSRPDSEEWDEQC